MLKPDAAFRVIRPDEVAECWEGVSSKLYGSLWACVRLYKRPKPEKSEEPYHGMDCVADFWDQFSPEEQALLNNLAELNQ